MPHSLGFVIAILVVLLKINHTVCLHADIDECTISVARANYTLFTARHTIRTAFKQIMLRPSGWDVVKYERERDQRLVDVKVGMKLVVRVTAEQRQLGWSKWNLDEMIPCREGQAILDLYELILDVQRALWWHLQDEFCAYAKDFVEWALDTIVPDELKVGTGLRRRLRPNKTGEPTKKEMDAVLHLAAEYHRMCSRSITGKWVMLLVTEEATRGFHAFLKQAICHMEGVIGDEFGYAQ